MTRGKNPGVGRKCPNCDRSILPGQHVRRANGAWEHRDCEVAAAIAYHRSTSKSGLPRRASRDRIDGIPTVRDSRTGHTNDAREAARVITAGRRQPRTWHEPRPGHAGGGTDHGP